MSNIHHLGELTESIPLHLVLAFHVGSAADDEVQLSFWQFLHVLYRSIPAFHALTDVVPRRPLSLKESLAPRPRMDDLLEQ